MSNIEKLKREAICGYYAGWAGDVLDDIRAIDEQEAREERIRDELALEAHAVRCPKCRAAMGNVGTYLCGACQSGMPVRYEP